VFREFTAVTRQSVRVTAVEAFAAAGITILAFALRVWRVSSLGVNHFDEGVYVFSALGLADSSQPATLFPNQTRFSPPFYFTTVSLLHRLTGWPVDVAALAVNIILGTATVLLVWWVGRRWFGPRAALAAAALLGLSQSHILMSRVALTDVAFSFLFLLTIALLVETVERASLGWAVLAGLAGGLLWNTKYHGWFSLLITGAALVPSLWFARSKLSELRRPVVAWLCAGAIAVAMYVPWAIYVRTADGYREIANYYLTLISTQWFANFARHVDQQMYLEGPASRAAIVAALGFVLAWHCHERHARAFVILGASAIATIFLGFFGVTSILAVLSVPALLRDFEGYRNRVVLAWLGLWIVAAPVYHPYARLLLPWTVLTCLLSGWWLVRIVDGAPRDVLAGRDSGRAWPALSLTGPPGRLALASFAVAAAVAFLGWQMRPAGNPWRYARDLDNVAAGIAQHVPDGQSVYVLGEPPLAFYVHTSGRPAFRRVGLPDLDTLTRDGYLVTGVYTDRAPNLARGMMARADRLTRLGEYRFIPNDLRLLDDFRPDRARVSARPGHDLRHRAVSREA
jgi:4-amino-4-deoxy-L-arabinose transferase-like glycosyltransferase